MTARSELRPWDGSAYHRLGNPQHAWGRAVLDRLPLRGDETVVDAGCGSGRLTAELLERLPRGHVVALDGSASMLEAAREYLVPRFGDRVSFVHADLRTLDLDRACDAVFSTATFHWIHDHDRLFAALLRALRPGGLLVAQCGGGPNLRRIHARAGALMRSEPFAAHFADFCDPWFFADAESSARRLEAAGFVDVATSVVEAPTVLGDEREYAEFLEKVVLGANLVRLTEPELQRRFVRAMTEGGRGDDPPWSLDYWRLNLQGRRPV